MLFNVNSFIVQYPNLRHSELESSSSVEEHARHGAFKAIVWNFLESVFRFELQNDEYLKPAMDDYIERYIDYFLHASEDYSLDFRKYIEKECKDIIRSYKRK